MSSVTHFQNDQNEWDENSLEEEIYDYEEYEDGMDEMEYEDDDEEEDPFLDSQEPYESPSNTGESSKSSTGFGSPSHESPAITPSSSAIVFNTKATNAAAISGVNSEEFTDEEMNQMKERIMFELNVKRRRSPVHWASPELQDLIKRLNFFKDRELNQLMSKMLLTLSFYNQVVSASIVVFFGVEAFQHFYLPNSIGHRQSHANKPPLPKYKLFHLFWQNINGPESSKTFKTIIIITNFHLRRMPVGAYDGNLQKAYKSTVEGNSVAKGKAISRQALNLQSLKRLKHNLTSPPKLSSLSKKQCTASGTKNSSGGNSAASSTSSSNSPAKSPYQTRQPVCLDEGGNAYFVALTGQKYFVNNPNQRTTFEEFFKASRLLCMKARAYSILKECSPIVQPMKYAPEAMEKTANLSYFPDEELNKLMSKVMFIDHSIYKMVQITCNVFWCDEERNTSIVPYRLPYLRLTHPAIVGHEFYYEFWDHIISFSTNEERKKLFEYAICNMNKFRTKEPNSDETVS